MSRDAWFRERLEPMCHRRDHGQVREHVARYRFAADRLRGRVLDAGCGTGYGSILLREGSRVRDVVGVDRDARAIAWARRYYGARDIAHVCRDLLSPSLAGLGPFDGIACLEVLEHLPEPERLLQRLDHVLAPGGRLVVSTPLGRGREVETRQPFHCFQLRRDEFARMLGARFDVVLYGQKGIAIESWRRGGRYFLMIGVCRSRTERRERWSGRFG